MLLKDNEIDNWDDSHYKSRGQIYTAPEEYAKEINKENEKEKGKREAEFRRWLIKNKPEEAIMIPIETSTAVGVPDIFSCYEGTSSWLECKINAFTNLKIRGAQLMFMRKLYQAGGTGKVVVQKISPRDYKPTSVDVYTLETIATVPLNLLTISGKNLVFPTSTKPYYRWFYRSNRKDKNADLNDLYLHILLDIPTDECYPKFIKK